MSMYLKLGDLMKSPKEQIIIHQVNCIGQARSGVCVPIMREYPKARDYYNQMCSAYRAHPEQLLGTAQIVWSPEIDNRIVVNMFTQLFNRRVAPLVKVHTDLDAMHKALQTLHEEYPNSTFAVPWLIGADRGGADMHDVAQVFKEELSDKGNTVIFYCLDSSKMPDMFEIDSYAGLAVLID